MARPSWANELLGLPDIVDGNDGDREYPIVQRLRLLGFSVEYSEELSQITVSAPGAASAPGSTTQFAVPVFGDTVGGTLLDTSVTITNDDEVTIPNAGALTMTGVLSATAAALALSVGVTFGAAVASPSIVHADSAGGVTNLRIQAQGGSLTAADLELFAGLSGENTGNIVVRGDSAIVDEDGITWVSASGGAVYLGHDDEEQTGSTVVRAPAGQTVALETGGTTRVTVADALVTVAVPLAVNAGAGDVSSVGMVRLPASATVSGKNASAADMSILAVNSSDLQLGGALAGARPSSIVLDCSSTHSLQVNGASYHTFTSTSYSTNVAAIQFAAAVSSPVIDQANDTANSATGDELRIGAQTCTGTTSVGGGLHLHSGDGTTDCGRVLITSGRQSVSSTRARALVYYDEAASDVITIGGAGPGSAYTRPINTDLDASSALSLRVAGITRVSVAATIVNVTVPTLRFTNGIAPVFTQQDNVSGAAGADFIVKAQSLTTATGTKVAGKLVLSGGDCSDGTDNTGGDVEISGGNASIGTTQGGNVILQGGQANMANGAVAINTAFDGLPELSVADDGTKGLIKIAKAASQLGFFGTAGTTKPTVADATELLNALHSMGLINYDPP